MQTPFHAYAAARRLAGLARSEAMFAVFASSSIKVYPHQIAAAEFAMRSHYIKGCILCDEGSLGKTYEALLIATQSWYEGKDRLLLVLPINLVGQWVGKIENGFSLPYVIWNTENDNNGEIPGTDGIIITTYDFAVRYAETIASQTWDMVIFDEADVLFKPENKTVAALKAATQGAYRLLLTPTPITMSIMDIYGLIHFIDETILPDADVFYKRYFRKPENYHELTAWVSQFAFRTLKSQVTDYVNFTERLPFVENYTLTPAERTLYSKVAAYLAMSKKIAYPEMDSYELSLMYYHILSSSPKAFVKTLSGTISRLANTAEDNEKIQKEQAQLEEIRELADGITESGKMKSLLITLKSCLAHMRRLKLNQKAIIFVNNLTTLDTLADLLEKHSYYTITGSSPYSIEHFRNRKKFAVLITTDTAAKGLDMEFCPLVINYDMLFNAIEMEQRISRCHRQGQTSDVIVVNLLSKENLSDVRIFELINKRISQFEGIFGMSDHIVGNFDLSLDDVLAQMRLPNEIQQAFETNLATNQVDNEQLVTNAEDVLFTTFTKSVAEKISITPQYIESQAAEIKAELWGLVKKFFAERDDYVIDEDNQTITLIADTAPEMLYYSTNSRNSNLHMGRPQYGMAQNFKPQSGRIALATPLVKGLTAGAECADRGTIVVSAAIEPCEIGLYSVSIIANIAYKRNWLVEHDIFVGKTQSGNMLSDYECREIMALPVLSYTENDKSTANWLRNVTSLNPAHEFDYAVPKNEILEQYLSKNGSAQADEIERIKLRAGRKKAALEHGLGDIRMKIKALKAQQASHATDRLKALSLDKELKELEKELKSKEQNLFFEQMRIDVVAEEEVEAITARERYDVQARQQFIIKVDGFYEKL